MEMHPDVDQLIRIESGHARVYMGNCRGSLREAGVVCGGYAVIIPAGTWHNIVNIGNCQLKLNSLYAPPNHPFGTSQRTKAEEDH